ncbi:hypothetical protein QWZ02_06225 [Kinneretia asaccharophila]|uniref:Uncharacterized protein n=1 Tax=Roseateles asaccharophilus TaxID=582607 RepID=A0A4R6N3G7_9BURK|nr:hypothetical protein [Roseateles asaccharophilus]MDN3544039.1 hypothetical protein [Roseateles asaccharophilus]TDP09366.1 hypothetical protein DFR39_105204 [Roseateles asaccharophilus]
MRTNDPFLRHILAAIDRALVWSILAVVLTALVWTAAWERGLGQPVIDGWRVLGLALLGKPIDRLALTLLAMSAALGIAGASLFGGWLFRRWKRRADVDTTRLRGARWESDQ